jgi:gas vesicle protein
VLTPGGTPSEAAGPSPGGRPIAAAVNMALRPLCNRGQAIEAAESTVTMGEPEMNTATQDNNTSDGGSFLLGLITGSAIGAGLALYFAPRLALELRQRVTDSATDLRNAASERVQAVATRVADVVEDVTKRGQAVRDGVADAVGRGAHEVGRGAREVERFAEAAKTGGQQ